MAVKAAHCKLCGGQHWSYEPHEFPKGLESRSWAKEFVNGRPQSFVEAPVKPVAVGSFPAVQLDDEDDYVLKECEVCGKEFEAQRKTARFCSNSCRQMAFQVRKASQQKDA